MQRKMIKIDEDLCTGCGACVPACAEGAIQIIDGKARVVREALCDGLGACLGECPEGALTIETREAEPFDEAQVAAHLAATEQGPDGGRAQAAGPAAAPVVAGPVAAAGGRGHVGETHAHVGGGGLGCPGARMMTFDAPVAAAPLDRTARPSELRQWPVQLHLVSPAAPYFQRADVLLCADCVPFTVGDFHKDHLRGKALAVACPKLDQGLESYVEKLAAMIDHAKINTLTVMIMQVPCCGGLMRLVQDAMARASRKVPVKVVVVGLRGEILSEEWAA